MPRADADFCGFVGQRRIVRRLKRWISGALKSAGILPHLLLIGRPGLGKSLLAKAIGNAMGMEIITIHAHKKLRRADILATIRSLRHADILFIDEAHSLDPDTVEGLYYAIDEGLISAPSPNNSGRTCDESVAQFTLILATTDPGRVPKPLRSRLTEVFMEEYRLGELRTIAKTQALKLDVHVTPQAASVLAKHCQGVPRRIHVWLETLRITFPGATQISSSQVARFLRGEGIDEHSLRPQQRSYLRLLVRAPKRRLSIKQLSAGLGLDPAYIRDEIEYFLLDRRFMEVVGNNLRSITDAGLEVIVPDTDAEV